MNLMGVNWESEWKMDVGMGPKNAWDYIVVEVEWEDQLSRMN